MKKHYLLIISVLYTIHVNGQVYNYMWDEKFEGMAINQPPSDDWLSTSGFNILGWPHGDTTFINYEVNALSCNLNAITLSDSVFSPKITGHNQFTSGIEFKIRICNWSAGIPISPAILNSGDTCYLSVYKYTGSVVSDVKTLFKIHAGIYTPHMGFTNIGITLQNILPSDTFRLAIHVRKLAAGDYWYDFDEFRLFYLTSIKDVNNNLLVSLFPNPAKTHISFKSDEEVQQIQLNDVYGKQIDFNLERGAEPYYKIHLNSSLSSGIYLISIKTNKRIINSRFAKD